MPLEDQQPVADTLQIGGAIGLGAVLMAWLAGATPKVLNWIGERVNKKVIEAEAESARREAERTRLLDELKEHREMVTEGQNSKISDMASVILELKEQVKSLHRHREECETNLKEFQANYYRMKEGYDILNGKVMALEQHSNPSNMASLIAKEMQAYNLPFKSS